MCGKSMYCIKDKKSKQKLSVPVTIRENAWIKAADFVLKE